MYTFMKEKGAAGVQESGGEGESGDGAGGGAEGLGPSVPPTMACGWVTLALMGCMLVLATSNSMIVGEGDTSKVSKIVR
jgi:hypothetical protein